MKKLLALIIAAAFAMPAFALEAPKKPATKTAPAKKEVKKHKKFEGTKVPEKAPAPAKKAPAKK